VIRGLPANLSEKDFFDTTNKYENEIEYKYYMNGKNKYNYFYIFYIFLNKQLYIKFLRVK
jgi:hypothetical protein